MPTQKLCAGVKGKHHNCFLPDVTIILLINVYHVEVRPVLIKMILFFGFRIICINFAVFSKCPLS